MASVAPLVTVTMVSGSIPLCPWKRAPCSAMATRKSLRPVLGAYWLTPSVMALRAASLTASGPSKSGKPCPRFIAPCLRASALNSEKTVVPRWATRPARICLLIRTLPCSGAYDSVHHDRARYCFAPRGCPAPPHGQSHHHRHQRHRAQQVRGVVEAAHQGGGDEAQARQQHHP